MSDQNLAYVSASGGHMRPMSAYSVVHYLLRQHRGPASKHWCVECAKPAQHWAYDHKDAFARVDATNGQIFSVNFDHYQPMCAGCHQRLDAQHKADPEAGAA